MTSYKNVFFRLVPSLFRAVPSGDAAMVMRAESMDLRKLAEVNGGGLSQNKLRKYASEMASVMRWVETLRLEGPQQSFVRTVVIEPWPHGMFFRNPPLGQEWRPGFVLGLWP